MDVQWAARVYFPFACAPQRNASETAIVHLPPCCAFLAHLAACKRAGMTRLIYTVSRLSGLARELLIMIAEEQPRGNSVGCTPAVHPKTQLCRGPLSADSLEDHTLQATPPRARLSAE
mmetsp:Transcript_105400/g.173147  ORF Transcript_105400/g.173147 Transcript_105400/m.173147 type:complete len:118 (+) Transcript_105400:2-355(+)